MSKVMAVRILKYQRGSKSILESFYTSFVAIASTVAEK